MSGSKKILVDRGAWAAAQQAAARMQTVNRELPRMLEAVRRDAREQIDQATAQTQARQAELERSLDGLSQQTKRIAAETNRRLQAKSELIWAQLQDSLTESRAEAQRELADLDERLRAELAEERDERARDVEALRADLDAVRGNAEQAVAAARATLADAGLLRAAIEASLPHQWFAPGRLAALDRRVAQAELNVAAGRGETALAQAQQAYLDLEDLREDVQLQHEQWQAARISAASAVSVLEQKIKLDARLDDPDEGNEQADEASSDVNFWSDGEFAALRDEAGALANQVTAEDGMLSAAELHRIAAETVPALEARLDEMVSQARARRFASQLRVNLAEVVVQTLEDIAGYTWEEGQALYAHDDQREAFYSKLRSEDSSEIVIEVAPEDGSEACVLRILSYDVGIPDEEERVRRAHEIAKALSAQGIPVGQPAAEEAPPDPAFTDFEWLRRAGPRQAAKWAGTGVARTAQEQG